MKPGNEMEKLAERLTRKIARTSIEYGVLEPGDRILVAVSGGKDSYTLLYLLARLIPRLPFSLEQVAVHVDQCQPGYDGSRLYGWLAEFGVPYEIVKEDTYSVVERNLKPGATACSICSRMRRGVLYSAAERLGCNKIALGHHRNDTLATLLLNLFYSGCLQAMPARYTSSCKRFEVVRPMIEIAEEEIATLAKLVGFPIVPCGLCSSQEDHQRLAMVSLINQLEKRNPKVKTIMLAAIKNLKPSHLLDKQLLEIYRDAHNERLP